MRLMHHEHERDEAQVRRHHRDVGEVDRLDEQQAHAGPLEHGLGDDRERDDAAQLQAGDRDHGHQRVLERVAEMDRAVGEPAGARELDVVGAQHLEHFRAHEPHDQRHLEQRQRDRRQDQRLQPALGQEAGRPPAERHRVAAAERRQPAQLHGEDEDQQDADQERRQADADQRRRQQDLREPAVASQRRVDAERECRRAARAAPRPIDSSSVAGRRSLSSVDTGRALAQRAARSRLARRCRRSGELHVRTAGRGRVRLRSRVALLHRRVLPHHERPPDRR